MLFAVPPKMPVALDLDSSANPNAQAWAEACRRAPLGGMGHLSPVSQPDAEVIAGLRKGEVIAGKYEIEEILGTGAMGVVVSARHVVLNERVAIKFLLPEVLQNPEAVARFMREARAAVRIKSEHVAHVTDIGTFEDGAPFMVMEHLEGVDLSSWLKSNGPFPVVQTVDFVLQACEAIAEAHTLGIIHRDLKPANLFCIRKRDGSLAIKVLDFGISKVTDFQQYSSSALSMTDASALMGSPNYMSPEQLQKPREVDNRTDLWSLGVILFELLAGTSPFCGESLPELIINITTQAPKPLRSIRAEVPAGLDVVIDRCLQKNRADRYADIGELALALGVFASKRAAACVERVIGILDSAGEAPASTRSASLSRSSAVAPRTEEQTKVTWGQTTPPRFGSRGWLLVGSIGFGAALGIGLLAWSQSVGLARAQSASPVAMTARVDEKLEQPRVLAVNSASVATDDPKTPVLSASPPVEDDPRAEPVVTAKNPAAPGAQSAATSSSSKAEKAARATSGSPKRAAQPANSRLDNAKHQPGAPRVECDPPYTLDALGRKHFKAECYLNQAQ